MSIHNPTSAPSRSDDGSLKKLEIRYETKKANLFDGTLKALFNPNQLRYQQAIRWQPTEPPQGSTPRVYQFQSVDSETLTLDLFFDTSEGDPEESSTLGLGSAGELASAVQPSASGLSGKPSATNVVRHTDKLVDLTRINSDLHRPPVCELWWGRFLLLRGVLTQLSQDFSFFLSNGTPVRASLSCTFMQLEDSATVRASKYASSDVDKTRVVRRGDTLASIAAEEYGDPALWRHIARANAIDNPRSLPPGLRLTIPLLPK